MQPGALRALEFDRIVEAVQTFAVTPMGAERLAQLSPATGGPYAYARAGYGDFAGFLIAWGYWISIWASLPAIAVAFSGSPFSR